MSVLDVRIPRLIQFRSYQGEFWRAMLAGCRRAILVWHRRAGKDLAVLNWFAAAMLRRAGTYYYFFPTYAQGKKIIWDGMDAAGRPFMANFPPELIIGKWEDEMRITLRLPDGRHSNFQIVGTDKMDSIVGTNPIGCAFSEYSLMNPRAWDFTRPILAENGGWAVFVYTPRGKNHGYKLWTNTEGDPAWFRSMKTVDETRRDAPGENGLAVVPLSVIDAERRSGMDEALILQEFYCSFEGALSGSYYGDLITRARAEGRVLRGLYNPRLPVDTAWDLGVDDATAIGFTQTVVQPNGTQVLNWVDYEEGSGAGLDHFVKRLRDRSYGYGEHFGPHDLRVQEWSTGNTRVQRAADLGLHFTVVPKLHIADGIEAARRLLAVSQFDEERCERLLDALMTYRREWDDKMMTWRSQPVHDWASHPADMVRYRGIAYYELGGDRAGAYAGHWDALGASEQPEPEGGDFDVFSSGR